MVSLIPLVLPILWLIHVAKRLCELAISRTQEYRADAVAVRLTRNPLALAEALCLIAKRWRGIGAPGESLSTIFIVDVGLEALSEQEGLLAILFSTHPPTRHRIELLLGMAHQPPEAIEHLAIERRRAKHVGAPRAGTAPYPRCARARMVRVDRRAVGGAADTARADGPARV